MEPIKKSPEPVQEKKSTIYKDVGDVENLANVLKKLIRETDGAMIVPITLGSMMTDVGKEQHKDQYELHTFYEVPKDFFKDKSWADECLVLPLIIVPKSKLKSK